VSECNWVGDPNARTLAHVIQCDECTGRWPNVAKLGRIHLRTSMPGPRMADGTYIWNNAHDRSNCSRCQATMGQDIRGGNPPGPNSTP
jgi:hypothetical protein